MADDDEVGEGIKLPDYTEAKTLLAKAAINMDIARLYAKGDDALSRDIELIQRYIWQCEIRVLDILMDRVTS